MRVAGGTGEGTQDIDAASRVVLSVLRRACRAGRKAATEPTRAAGRLKNSIEKHWIRLLHEAFWTKYATYPYRVLSTSKPDKDFGLSQYLFDLTVIRMPTDPTCRSLVHRKELPLVREAIWQVELELAGDGRKIAVDLGKLVCGSARNKLLIVRRPTGHSPSIDKANKLILNLSVGCVGNLFIAHIPSYASEHAEEQKYHLKPEIRLPFKLYARRRTHYGWKLAKISTSLDEAQ